MTLGLRGKIFSVDNLRKHAHFLTQAAEQVQQGQLVAFPTECGYRLGACAEDEAALRRLYEASRRHPSRPLTLHFPDLATTQAWLGEPAESARKLMDFFWPGPLVVLLPGSTRVHSLVRADLTKVGVRIPHHPLAQELLRQTGPLAGVSARSVPLGAVLMDPVAVAETYGPHLGSILEWREPPLGLTPTVVDASRDPVRVLSVGFIRTAELSAVLPRPPVLSGDAPTPRRFERYFPQARLIVVEGETERVPRRLRTLIDSYASNERVALMVTQETAEGAFSPPPRVSHFAVMCSRHDPEPPETQLFETLRRLEGELRVSVILVEGLPRVGKGATFMERLCQEAHQVINTEDPGYSGQAGLRKRERDG